MVQGMVAYACYPSTRQEETGGLRRPGVQGCLQLHTDFNVSLGNGYCVTIKKKKNLNGVVGEKEKERAVGWDWGGQGMMNMV